MQGTNPINSNRSFLCRCNYCYKIVILAHCNAAANGNFFFFVFFFFSFFFGYLDHLASSPHSHGIAGLDF